MPYFDEANAFFSNAYDVPDYLSLPRTRFFLQNSMRSYTQAPQHFRKASLTRMKDIFASTQTRHSRHEKELEATIDTSYIIVPFTQSHLRRSRTPV